MLTLRLIRCEVHEHSTIGLLLTDGRFFSYTLEDPIGPQKDDSNGPIPCGTYPITVYFSPKFQRQVLLLHGVPGREWVEFHPGNTEIDTKGCILPGMGRGPESVNASGEALRMLVGFVARALARSEAVTLTIEELL